jgi:DNA-binding LacI/PurR family transcriptional regulator
VLCFNNTLARLFYEELRRRGYQVPGDFSVVGGGGEEVAGLTCNQVDWFRMGGYAVQILLRALAPGTHPPEHYLYPHTLRGGQTTAAPEA